MQSHIGTVWCVFEVSNPLNFYFYLKLLIPDNYSTHLDPPHLSFSQLFSHPIYTGWLNVPSWSHWPKIAYRKLCQINRKGQCSVLGRSMWILDGWSGTGSRWSGNRTQAPANHSAPHRIGGEKWFRAERVVERRYFPRKRCQPLHTRGFETSYESIPIVEKDIAAIGEEVVAKFDAEISTVFRIVQRKYWVLRTCPFDHYNFMNSLLLKIWFFFLLSLNVALNVEIC